MTSDSDSAPVTPEPGPGSPTPPTAGQVIREAREAAGLARSALAAKMGLTDQYIYQVETGRRRPTLETLWAFSVALGIDPHRLDARWTSRRPRRK